VQQGVSEIGFRTMLFVDLVRVSVEGQVHSRCTVDDHDSLRLAVNISLLCLRGYTALFE